jgi:protein-disulfide isomerase
MQRTLPVVGALLLVRAITACGGGASDTGAGAAREGGAGRDACREYVVLLCDELGRESAACREAHATLALVSPRVCQAGIDDFAVSRERIGALRAACDEVAERVCRDLGEDSRSCVAVRRDAPSIPPGHCEGLRREYGALRASLERREALLAPVTGEVWAALAAGDPPSLGAPDAKVVLIAFSDFECPYCAKLVETVAEVRKRYGERVRFVFRNFPLSFHAHARPAARAAMAAHAQGKFWPYHDLLFAHQDALTRADFVAHAKGLSLDVPAFEKALDDPAIEARVAADVSLGEDVGVPGTPTLFADGERIEDPFDFDALAKKLDAKLSE